MICPCCGGTGVFSTNMYHFLGDIRGEMLWGPYVTATCTFCAGNGKVDDATGAKYLADLKVENFWFWRIWMPLLFAFSAFLIVIALLISSP